MVTAAVHDETTHRKLSRWIIPVLFLIATVGLSIAFGSWTASHHAIEWPALERDTAAHYPAGHYLLGGVLAVALALVGAAAAVTGSRAADPRAGWKLPAWLAVSIAAALPVSIYTSPALASPFILSAIIAIVLTATRRHETRNRQLNTRR